MYTVEMCHLAIVAFWRAFYRSLGYPFDLRMAKRYAFDDATYLLTQGELGLRYGGPGWPHLKLHLERDKGFYLGSNGMDTKEFLQFQAVVAEEFEKENLPFRSLPS